MTKDNSVFSSMLQVMKSGSIKPLPKTLQKSVHGMETPIISPSKYAQKSHQEGISGQLSGTIKLCIFWLSVAMVTLSLLSAMAVNLRGYGEPLLAKGLGCCAKASLFCTTTPGAIVLSRHVTGYGTTAGSLWTTIPNSRRVGLHFAGSHKKHLAGKRFVIDTRMRQAVTTWPKPLDTFGLCLDTSLGVKVEQMITITTLGHFIRHLNNEVRVKVSFLQSVCYLIFRNSYLCIVRVSF